MRFKSITRVCTHLERHSNGLYVRCEAELKLKPGQDTIDCQSCGSRISFYDYTRIDNFISTALNANIIQATRGRYLISSDQLKKKW